MTGPILDPFILGFVSGGFLFGCVFCVIGCVLGYDAGARYVKRLYVEADARGDVPSVDPSWGDR